MAASFLGYLNIATVLIFLGYGEFLFPSDAGQWLLRFFISMGALSLFFTFTASAKKLQSLSYEKNKLRKSGWWLVAYIAFSIAMLIASMEITSP
jgi:hypothetical protein